MKSINNVILAGMVAADVDVTPTRRGIPLAVFPIATKRSFTSNGDPKDVTDYHRIVVFGELATACGESVRKGRTVYVQGFLLNRAFESKGERRFVTEVRAESVKLLSMKKHGDSDEVSLVSLSDAGSESGRNSTEG